MKKSREMLEKKLGELFPRLPNRQWLFDNVEERYGIPVDITSDLVTFRKSIEEFSDYILFAVLSFVEPESVKEFFSDEEIKVYSNEKYKVENVSFPLRFDNMVQVAPDQWVGVITAKRLMELKDAQIIKYDENTQRALVRVVRGEDKYYKIALNKNSVREIRECFEKGVYIPDDITLNIPEEANFYFKDGEIVIENPTKLAIVDGYHRYIAISQASQSNPDFDYPMEIRITNFSTEKAKQFIFQKDKKTLMKKVDSQSMNQYDPANRVVQRLNQDPMCNIQGLITAKGPISFAEMCRLVHYYYFKDRKGTAQDIIEVKNILQGKFNRLTEERPEYLSREVSKKELNIIMFVFSRVNKNEAKAIDFMLAGEYDNKLFQYQNGYLVRKKLINELTRRLGEWRDV